MAETVTCSMSVLLKLKTMSTSTHVKKNNRCLKEIKIITCTSIEVCLETRDQWQEQLALRDEENLSVCLLNHSTHSKTNMWLPIDVNNEPMKHLLVKHFKMYKALRLKYVHKREIMSLK